MQCLLVAVLPTKVHKVNDDIKLQGVSNIKTEDELRFRRELCVPGTVFHITIVMSAMEDCKHYRHFCSWGTRILRIITAIFRQPKTHSTHKYLAH